MSEVPEFEEYLARNGAEVPEALRQGGPVPKTWPHGQEAWQALAAKAREHLGLKPMFNFAYGVAVQGHYTDELASGQLRPGALTNAATGAVVRPPEPTITPATEDRARDALRALAARNLKIEVVLQQKLELAAYGRYTSHPRGAEAAVSAAESAVWQHESRRQAAAKEETERPWLVVRFAFRGPGGRSFAVGRQQVEPALVDELREWQETMEAQADQHGWDAPSGHTAESWPTFTIEEADA